MGNMPNVRQFYEPCPGDGVGRLFRQFRNISEIPAKIDGRPILQYGCVILAADDNKRGDLNVEQLVTDRLLVDHQGRQRGAKGPAWKIAAETNPETRLNKNFRLIRWIGNKIALHVFAIILKAEISSC